MRWTIQITIQNGLKSRNYYVHNYCGWTGGVSRATQQHLTVPPQPPTSQPACTRSFIAGAAAARQGAGGSSSQRNSIRAKTLCRRNCFFGTVFALINVKVMHFIRFVRTILFTKGINYISPWTGERIKDVNWTSELLGALLLMLLPPSDLSIQAAVRSSFSSSTTNHPSSSPFSAI